MLWCVRLAVKRLVAVNDDCFSFIGINNQSTQ